MSFRHYDTINTTLSSRQRTLVRRALEDLEYRILEDPRGYANEFGINSEDTLKTHKRDIQNLKDKLNV